MNAAVRPELAELREMIRLIQSPAQRAGIPFSLLPGGLPKGALTEITGPHGAGKSALVLKCLAENPLLRAAWIEDELSVYPCAFPQQGVHLERVLFSEAGPELLWAAHQILRSGLFPIVVLSAHSLPGENAETDLRRLQLSAEKSGSSVVLLAEQPLLEHAWPITLQIEVTRSAPLRFRIRKGPGVRGLAAEHEGNSSDLWKTPSEPLLLLRR